MHDRDGSLGSDSFVKANGFLREFQKSFIADDENLPLLNMLKPIYNFCKPNFSPQSMPKFLLRIKPAFEINLNGLLGLFCYSLNHLCKYSLKHNFPPTFSSNPWHA